jgi:hypothetical protein
MKLARRVDPRDLLRSARTAYAQAVEEVRRALRNYSAARTSGDHRARHQAWRVVVALADRADVFADEVSRIERVVSVDPHFDD